MANPIGELSEEDKALIVHSYQNPDEEGSKEVIQAYESNSKPQYTNDNQLIQPKFAPIDPELLKQPESMMSKAGNALNPFTEEKIQGNIDVAKNVGKAVAGAAIGGAELLNPLSAPRGLEVLGRGAYKYATSDKGFLDSISAADKEANTFAPMTLRQLAPIARSAVKAPFSDKSLPEVYDQEVAAQEAFQGDPIVQGAQTTTEIGGAVASLGALVRNVSKLPKVQQIFTKLKGVRTMRDPVGAQGLTRDQLKKTASLQRQLLGDLAPELETALYQNTEEVKTLLNGPSEGRSVLSTVEKVRESLQGNKELLGETIGEFRYALAAERPDKFDTRTAINALNEFKKRQTLSGGMSTLDPKDAAQLETFQEMLKNSGKGAAYQFDTRDANVMVDKIDDYLKKQGFFEGKNNTSFNQQVMNLRESIDSEIAAKYPAYKEVKARYSDFLKDYSQIQNKIEGLGAESFVANLYGRNKSEVRQLLERTLNKGNETKSAFQNAVMDSGNISSQNKRYNDVVALMRQKAEKIQFQEGKEVMQEVANKAMSRKLAEISDPAADKLQTMIEAHIRNKGKKVSGASTMAGTVGGTWLGNKLGNPSAGGVVGGGFGYSAGEIIKGAREPAWRSQAEYLYSVERLLDTLEKEKKVAASSKAIAKDIKWVWNTFGPEAGEAFLNKMNMTSDFTKDMDYAFAVSGGIQGLQKGFQEKGERSFANDVLKSKKEGNQ